jgi:hypothetical protein
MKKVAACHAVVELKGITIAAKRPQYQVLAYQQLGDIMFTQQKRELCMHYFLVDKTQIWTLN